MELGHDEIDSVCSVFAPGSKGNITNGNFIGRQAIEITMNVDPRGNFIDRGFSALHGGVLLDKLSMFQNRGNIFN